MHFLNIFRLCTFRFQKAYPQNSHIFTRSLNIHITPFHTKINFKSNNKHKNHRILIICIKNPLHINNLCKKPSHINNSYKKPSYKPPNHTHNPIFILKIILKETICIKKPHHILTICMKNDHILTILMKNHCIL